MNVQGTAAAAWRAIAGPLIVKRMNGDATGIFARKGRVVEDIEFDKQFWLSTTCSHLSVADVCIQPMFASLVLKYGLDCIGDHCSELWARSLTSSTKENDTNDSRQDVSSEAQQC